MLRERSLVAAAGHMTICDNELLTRVGLMPLSLSVVHIVTTLAPEVCSRSTQDDEINRAYGLKSKSRKEKKNSGIQGMEQLDMS